jgi:hypothetical protein
VVTDYRSEHGMFPVSILSLIRRGLSAELDPLVGLLREMRGTLFPPAMTGGTLFCLQSTASTNLAGDAELAGSGQLLFLLVLVTSFFCDTACSTALGFFTNRLIAPFWHRVRERRPALPARSIGRVRSIRQLLCSPCRNEKNLRPFRSVQISHNPPPHIPSLSTYSYI